LKRDNTLKNTFDGYYKNMDSFLQIFEKKWKPWLVKRMPKYIQGYHLTLSTIIWSILIVVFSYFSSWNIHWLWLVSLMIFLQYITDSIDGLLGITRKDGLAKWGYYMDHFLDYVFICSIIFGYFFIVTLHYRYMLLFILAIFGAYMINTFLYFSVTQKFKITYMYVGPSEVRLIFIIINTLLIFFGKTFMGFALPYILVLSSIGLVIVVYRVQKEILIIDKKKNIDKQ